ncbi:uncharacterized protein E0L32_004099 [Thyridium curvatum]|uniref:DJ-1/PfpI domain-containing protein n=1 Tax=Thyridium curvatum TaxID=1093900 RepID=A0A507BBS6_9PEZI|nr:uncharacterized protein E0L32_004099 [Thyridium curvatum]TPX16104.1 hypothetical protein E0L32_004099 [Thyridium curvatum]
MSRLSLLAGLLSLTHIIHAINITEQAINQKRTLSLGVIVFPGWEPLDVFGPMEIFFSLSYPYKIRLSVISKTAGPVSSTVPPFSITGVGPPIDYGYLLNPTIMASHSFEDAPPLDVLLVPGGFGNVVLEQRNDTSIEGFIRRRFDQLDYLLSVCTGAMSLAKAGVLNGRRATTNKGAWGSVVRHGENITWVPTARWVEDGKVWSSSGVAAGMDMAYAFLSHFYGTDRVNNTMNGIEYAPHTDPNWDPFSVVHKVCFSSPFDCMKTEKEITPRFPAQT